MGSVGGAVSTTEAGEKYGFTYPYLAPCSGNSLESGRLLDDTLIYSHHRAYLMP